MSDVRKKLRHDPLLRNYIALVCSPKLRNSKRSGSAISFPRLHYDCLAGFERGDLGQGYAAAQDRSSQSAGPEPRRYDPAKYRTASWPHSLRRCARTDQRSNCFALWVYRCPADHRDPVRLRAFKRFVEKRFEHDDNVLVRIWSRNVRAKTGSPHRETEAGHRFHAPMMWLDNIPLGTLAL